MDVSPCSTASHFLWKEGTWNLIFCTQIESQPQQKSNGINYKGLPYAVWSSYNHPYTSKECCWTVKQKWISLHAVYHPISCAERVPKGLLFYIKFESWFWQKLHGVDHKVFIYPVQSSSNHAHTSEEGWKIFKQQWMSLNVSHHPISCAERVPEVLYFTWNLRVVLTEITRCWP